MTPSKAQLVPRPFLDLSRDGLDRCDSTRADNVLHTGCEDGILPVLSGKRPNRHTDAIELTDWLVGHSDPLG